MSKFNTKKEKIQPTSINDMGEKAYKLSKKEELLATCLTTFLQKSYYESENEVVNRIKSSAKEVDVEFVAKLAIYLRRDANMRSVTHLLAADAAERLSGKEFASRFYRNIAQRPDDMAEILAAYFANGNTKIANSIKKGFRAKLESMDAYLIDKYKMKGKEISLIDLVNLFHPKPKQINEQAYRNLMTGVSLDGLYDSKIFEKEMTKAGQKAKSEGSDVEVAKEEAITSVIENVKGMPIMNLIRNLRNIILLAPNKLDDALEQLTNKETILNSKLLPFRFVTAYDEIEKMNAKLETKSAITFESEAISNIEELKAKTLRALETALEFSVGNIPALEGNTAVLVDHSGSVRGDGGGLSKVSAFSKATTAMIGNLFGSMLAYSQRDVYVGLFGDRLIPVPMDRTKGLLEHNKNSFALGASCGGGTENGLYIFLDDAIKNKKRVDNLVIFSDMVIGSTGTGGWDGTSRAGLGSFQELFLKFKKVNPLCNTVCVDIKQTKGTSVFNKSLNVLQVAGWSDKIFNLIEANSKGYEALIKEIESIKI